MLNTIQEFSVIERLDETHQGKTQVTIGRHNNQLLVCKSISKTSLTDKIAIEHVLNEKQALKYFTERNINGVNKLIHTFQDSDNLYMMLKPVYGLPLHKLLQMVGQFNHQFTFMIIVQIGLILKEFHQNGYIYRDIKASNFMINQKGQITMIDLGHAKKIDHNRTYTICGTTHSMPPQAYQQAGYSYQFDHYGYGILLYELLYGKPPFGFSSTNPNIVQDMKKGISEQQLNYIENPLAKDLIKQLLGTSERRLGCKSGMAQILEHEYFNSIQFLEAKDIYEGLGQIDRSDQKFEFYISEIVDFGLQAQKYNEILPDDPFYKFFS